MRDADCLGRLASVYQNWCASWMGRCRCPLCCHLFGKTGLMCWYDLDRVVGAVVYHREVLWEHSAAVALPPAGCMCCPLLWNTHHISLIIMLTINIHMFMLSKTSPSLISYSRNLKIPYYSTPVCNKNWVKKYRHRVNIILGHFSFNPSIPTSIIAAMVLLLALKHLTLYHSWFWCI